MIKAKKRSALNQTQKTRFSLFTAAVRLLCGARHTRELLRETYKRRPPSDHAPSPRPLSADREREGRFTSFCDHCLLRQQSVRGLYRCESVLRPLEDVQQGLQTFEFRRLADSAWQRNLTLWTLLRHILFLTPQ